MHTSGEQDLEKTRRRHPRNLGGTNSVSHGVGSETAVESSHQREQDQQRDGKTTRGVLSGPTNRRSGRKSTFGIQPPPVGESVPNFAIGDAFFFLSFCHLVVVRFRPPLPATMSSPLPWIPSLNGNVLDPCPLIADLIADDLKPNSRVDSDRRWSMTALGPLLDADPEMKAPLWAAVVAIWRLRCSEEEGRNCETWRSHLQAWLVRHICS